jgi:multidrug efflux pump subunit AcrB
VQDRGEVGPRSLQAQTENLIDKGNKQPSLLGLFTVYKTSSPQLSVKVNEAKCSDEGVEPLDVYATMQATLGQRYVNDFNLFGRTWQVNVQSDALYRHTPEDVKYLKVRSKNGTLVPLNTLAEIKSISGPLVITRYNMYPAAAINASVAPGASSGEATAVMEQLAKSELPTNMGYEWTELTFIEQRSRDTGMAVFGLAVLVVFLVLAALYESWTLPLAVILVVPTCVACSLAGIWVTNWDTVQASDFDVSWLPWNPMTSLGILKPDTIYGVNVASSVGLSKQDVNLFTQVGFVVLIGLACKNAILIVEYAKLKRDAGADRRSAILDACRLRLRPILMTSFAFILGVMPLAFASGAGAEMRQALGIAVFSGMLGVTLFGVLLTPVFYVVVDRVAGGRIFHSQFAHWLGGGLRNIVLLSFPLRVGGLILSKLSKRSAAR